FASIVSAQGKTVAEKMTLTGHNLPVYCLAFSPDGKTIATGSGDWKTKASGNAKLWDVATGKVTATLEGFNSQVWGLAFSPDGKWLATANGSGQVRVFEVATRREIATLPQGTGIRPVKFSPDGQLLAVGLGNGQIKLWNTSTWQERTALAGHREIVFSVDFS